MQIISNPIKDQFIKNTELFGLTKETRRVYFSGVRCLAKHYNQSPEKLTNDQVRDFFRYLLLEKKLAWSSCKTYLSGISAVGKSMPPTVCRRVREAGNCRRCCPWKK